MNTKLDQWEWQGTTRSIDIDPEDYRGMSIDAIKESVYGDIRRDAEQNLHLVYTENNVAQEVIDALKASNDETEDQ